METKKHLYDRIPYELILGLRHGALVDTHATVAHFMKDDDCAYHVARALSAADKITEAARALRLEIANLEANDAAAMEAAE